MYSLLQTSVYLSPRTASRKWSLSQKSTVLIFFNACKNTCYLSVCCRIDEVPWNTPCISYMTSMWLGHQSTIYEHNLTYTICSKSIYIQPPGQTRKHCFPASIGFSVWANQWWQTKKHCFSPQKICFWISWQQFLLRFGQQIVPCRCTKQSNLLFIFNVTAHLYILATIVVFSKLKNGVGYTIS